MLVWEFEGSLSVNFWHYHMSRYFILPPTAHTLNRSLGLLWRSGNLDEHHTIWKWFSRHMDLGCLSYSRTMYLESTRVLYCSQRVNHYALLTKSNILTYKEYEPICSRKTNNNPRRNETKTRALVRRLHPTQQGVKWHRYIHFYNKWNMERGSSCNTKPT